MDVAEQYAHLGLYPGAGTLPHREHCIANTAPPGTEVTRQRWTFRWRGAWLPDCAADRGMPGSGIVFLKEER